jgi:hypothetical protein
MSIKLKLQNVRLSYPALHKPRTYKGNKDSTPKYSVTCLLDPKKNKKDIAAIEEAMEDLIEEEFKGKRPKGMRVILKDGNDKTDDDDNIADGYEDMRYIKASSKKKPVVVDRDLTPLGEDDTRPYGGCYGNVSIRMYAQNNDFGRHINITLLAVQFAGDGEAFGDSAVNAEDEFEDLSDEDDGRKSKKGKKSKKRSRDEDDDDDDLL